MCLAVPAKILRIDGERALVDFGRAEKEIKIVLTPDVKPGDWVMVHAGFSIQKLSEELKEYEILSEEQEKN